MDAFSQKHDATAKETEEAQKSQEGVAGEADAASESEPTAEWVRRYADARDFSAAPVHRTSDKPFLFSVIIAIYNTEKYLAECLESVINQTVGFVDNIQLVLVNDGSRDASGRIAQRYAALYPDNIVYIEQENSGVSVSRNNGVKLATGTFLNFTDSDDLWSKDSFEHVVRFMDAHPDLNLITTRKRFFGAQTELHPLSKLLSYDAVVDIRQFIGQIENSVNSSFIHRSVFPNEGFDERMSLSEDFYLVTSVIMAQTRFGRAAAPIYWYRKRGTASAIGGSLGNAEYFAKTPYLCYKRIFDNAKARFGKVPLYFQYAVMYDLQWRLRADRNACNPPDGWEPYKAAIVELLQDIGPAMIKAQSMSVELKVYSLSLKYGVSFEHLVSELFVIRETVCWETPSGEIVHLGGLSGLSKMWVELVDYDDQSGLVTIEGRLDSFLDPSRLQLVARWGDGPDECALATLKKSIHRFTNVVFEEDPVSRKTDFEVSIPLKKTSFEVSVDGIKANQAMGLGKFAPFVRVDKGYTPMGGKLARWTANSFVPVRKTEKRLAVGNRQIARIIRSRMSEGQAERTIALREAILANRAAHRRIWVISDRITAGNDNGEALFEYLREHPVPGVEVYFAISADVFDFERIAAIGPVVPYGSDEYVVLAGSAEAVISSQADEYVINPFGSARAYFRDIPRPKFVFLQHGITMNDLSSWLHRKNKDIRLFVTSAKRERDSIVDNPSYGYGEDIVKLTGFPRHDKLLKMAATQSTPPKQILIAPTWRRNLTFEQDPETGQREKYPGFTESAYFKFFNSLINDERLATAMKQHGYSAKFILHPTLKQEFDEFSSTFCDIEDACTYSEEFVSSAILVTDYSSVSFDFALLERPILYAQYDRDTFFGNQLYDQGYFSYEADGFGPICTNYEETVAALLRLIENPVMEEKYVQRKRTFLPDVGCRCENVVNEILAVTSK